MEAKQPKPVDNDTLKARAEWYSRTEQVAPVKGKRVALLHFRMGREQYLIEARLIEEVSGVGRISRFPRQKNCLLGVTNMHGGLVPVIDLARLLELEASKPGKTSRIILVRSGAHMTGLVADEVFGYLTLDSGLAQAPGASLARSGTDFITGLFEREGAPLAWLYIERILETVSQQLAA